MDGNYVKAVFMYDILIKNLKKCVHQKLKKNVYMFSRLHGGPTDSIKGRPGMEITGNFSPKHGDLPTLSSWS